MGSDLYMEAQRMEPAFRTVDLLKRKVKKWKFKLDDGTEVIKVSDFNKWAKDFDPVWNGFEEFKK